MFALKREKSKFFKVKRGQSVRELESALLTPADGAFAGMILEVNSGLTLYRAAPLDSYPSISKKFGVGEEELRRLNGNRALYPTRAVFVPKR